jgi:hypothetical protein
MLRNGMIFMYMYPVLREKEVLIRKLFSSKEETKFQLQTHVYEYQKYQMKRFKESGMCDYSMYKYFIPVSQVPLLNKIEQKVENKNDQMNICDLFYLMSP